MIINSYFIQLTGKANIPEPLELGSGYHVSIEGEITKVSDTNNHDGSADRVFKLEPIKCEILDERGKVITAKDTRSMSKKFRAVHYKLWEANDRDVPDQEQAYDRTMRYILNNAAEIYEKALEK